MTVLLSQPTNQPTSRMINKSKMNDHRCHKNSGSLYQNIHGTPIDKKVKVFGNETKLLAGEDELFWKQALTHSHAVDQLAGR